MSTKSHEVIFGSQGRTTLWRSYNSRVLKATSPRKWSRPPSRGRQFLKNMAPNFFGCPDSTPARGPESGSSPRATRVGKLMERCRRVDRLGRALCHFLDQNLGRFSLLSFEIFVAEFAEKTAAGYLKRAQNVADDGCAPR